MTSSEQIPGNWRSIFRFHQTIYQLTHPKSIVSQFPAPPKLLDPNAATELDFIYLRDLLSRHSTHILERVDDDELRDLLDKLGQYRHIDNFLSMKYTTDQQITIRLTIETQVCRNLQTKAHLI